MSATDDNSSTERVTISFRVDKDVKKTMQHEAVEREIQLSELAEEMLLDGWTRYVNEEGLKHRGE